MRKRDRKREDRQRVQIGAGLLMAVLTLMGAIALFKNPSLFAASPEKLMAVAEFSVK